MKLSDKVLFSYENIQEKLGELSLYIKDNFDRNRLVLVGVLDGARYIMRDLLPLLAPTPPCDFIKIKTYKGTNNNGTPTVVLRDLDFDIAGKEVLVVDDILDTGRTLSFIADHLRKKKPARLELCALLRKHSIRLYPVELSFCGFEVADRWIVGYGMDYNERYRDLPYLTYLISEQAGKSTENRAG